MDVYDIVLRLVGPVNPVGETNTDNDRFENLKELVVTTSLLLTKIEEVALQNSDRGEFSMKRAGLHCSEFLNRIGFITE